MVHPVTGETISSYKKLMHDPATAETWQTAFGKDFGGMTQGDDKTGQKGSDVRDGPQGNQASIRKQEEIHLRESRR